MNIGGYASLNLDPAVRETDREQEDREDERDKRERLARTAQRRGAQRKLDARDAELLQRSLRPVPTPGVIAEAGIWTKFAAEAEMFDALVEKGAYGATTLQEGDETASDIHEREMDAPSCDATGELRGAASTRLSGALDELRDIAAAIDAFRQESDGFQNRTDSTARAVFELPTDQEQENLDVPPCRVAQVPGPTRAASPLPLKDGDPRRRACERLEAKLAFAEGFHVDALSEPEQALVRTGIAQLRAAVALLNEATDRPPREAIGERQVNEPAASAKDVIADERLGKDAPLDRGRPRDELAANSRERRAEGAPLQAVPIQPTGQPGLQPARAFNPGSEPARIDAVVAARRVAGPARSLEPAASGAVPAPAVAGLNSEDEKRARFKLLLDAQEDVDEGNGAGAATQQESGAAQQRIDARHAGDTLPLVVLRSL